MAIADVFLLLFSPVHWEAQVLAGSSLHGSKVIFWWDDSQLSMQALQCGVALLPRAPEGGSNPWVYAAGFGCCQQQQFLITDVQAASLLAACSPLCWPYSWANRKEKIGQSLSTCEREFPALPETISGFQNKCWSKPLQRKHVEPKKPKILN